MSQNNEGSPGSRQPAAIVYKRDKKTKASVVIGDMFARYGIMAGGTLVIVAVFTMMAFLVYVCLPLLDPGRINSVSKFALGSPPEPVLLSLMDEQQTIAASVHATGKVDAFHVGTGRSLQAPSFEFPAPASAFASTLRGDDVLFGFDDGTVRVGRLDLKSAVLPADQVPAGIARLNGRDQSDGRAIYSHIPGQFRRTSVEVSQEAPVQIADSGTAILLADYRVGGTAERPLKTFVTLDASGTLRLSQASSEINMMTGEANVQVSNSVIPVQVPAISVFRLLLNTPGDRVLVALRDGTVLRYATRDFAHPVLAETVRVLGEGVQLTAISYQNGENSIVVGGSDGSVSVWFGVDVKSKSTSDGVVLTQVHGTFDSHKSAVTDIRVSQRTRLFATSDALGNVWVRHGTTERTLLLLPGGPDKNGLASTVFSPKDDGVLAVGKNGKAVLWQIRIPHPETTLQSLFGKVWYEGYSEPAYVWQSTAGTDAPEPKLSLIPLIFGTLKAAIYSLMLAVPIALLAAIYTSEFMHPRTRSVVKPVMELMATLPSVVVGFVAALVLSPIVENWIAAVVIAFGLLPLVVVSVSFFWQLLPQSLANRLDGLPKLGAYLVAIVLALWVSVQTGPLIEALFFGGDFKKWTSGEGSGQPFLFLLLVPVCLLAVIAVTRPYFNATYRLRLREQPKLLAATSELVGWFAVLTLTLGLAYVGSLALQQWGYDVRGGVVDSYVQRNALVVAFAMAFTQIPIIYSISEDALNAVPAYLRSGSLACGASRWQTANRIVVPTAASGIFSAMMIGLGRAVGETMIVVMATGNTPILDANIFNGLRTLSANINVELPEAVRDSTLYRTLFLCALVLFAMTFVINTLAELVRLRYRRRAAQL